MTLVVIIVLIAGVFMVVTTSRPAALAIGAHGHPIVRDVLVRRFMERSQRFRRSGAIVGLVATVAFLIASSSMGKNDFSVNFLVLASIGLAGSIGGSILAEGYRVRQRGPRIASLDVRDPDMYRDRIADRREQALLALAVVGVAGALVTGEHLAGVIVLGAVVVVLAVVRHWVMHRIALRPRLDVPEEVEAADDEVRRLASSAGISRPMVTLGALVVSMQWIAVVSEGAGLARPIEIASVVAWLGSIVLALTAWTWWWANRSFGLTPVQLQGADGPRPPLKGWALAVLVLCLAILVLLAMAAMLIHVRTRS